MLETRKPWYSCGFGMKRQRFLVAFVDICLKYCCWLGKGTKSIARNTHMIYVKVYIYIYIYIYINIVNAKFVRSCVAYLFLRACSCCNLLHVLAFTWHLLVYHVVLFHQQVQSVLVFDVCFCFYVYDFPCATTPPQESISPGAQPEWIEVRWKDKI